MNELVLDASAAIAWLLGENDTLARRVALRAVDSILLVPAIWHAEMANALLAGAAAPPHQPGSNKAGAGFDRGVGN